MRRFVFMVGMPILFAFIVFVSFSPGWGFLMLTLTLATWQWLLGRWATKETEGVKDDSNVKRFCLWLCLSGVVFNAGLLVIRGSSVPTLEVVIAGILFGIAYGVGFCWCIMTALKIGPVGPTTVFNNMGTLGAVLYSCTVLNPRIPPTITIIGLSAMIVGAVVISLSKEESGEHGKITSLWLILAILGWLFSCLSQALSTHIARAIDSSLDSAIWYTLVGLSFASIILALDPRVRRGSRKREILGGVMNGVNNAVLTLLVIATMWYLDPVFALPTINIAQVVIMSFIGYYWYKESLSMSVLTGIALAVVGIIMVGMGET